VGAVTQRVFAELRGGVTRVIYHFRKRRIALLNSTRRAWNADGRHTGANGHLPGDECGTTGRATRLAVVISEEDAVLGDRIDVRRPAHHAMRVGANVPHADVVTPDNDDVRFHSRLGNGHIGKAET